MTERCELWLSTRWRAVPYPKVQLAVRQLVAVTSSVGVLVPGVSATSMSHEPTFQLDTTSAIVIVAVHPPALPALGVVSVTTIVSPRNSVTICGADPVCRVTTMPELGPVGPADTVNLVVVRSDPTFVKMLSGIGTEPVPNVLTEASV